jgi:hypothetical protein
MNKFALLEDRICASVHLERHSFRAPQLEILCRLVRESVLPQWPVREICWIELVTAVTVGIHDYLKVHVSLFAVCRANKLAK